MKTQYRFYPLPDGQSLSKDYPLIVEAFKKIDDDINKLDNASFEIVKNTTVKRDEKGYIKVSYIYTNIPKDTVKYEDIDAFYVAKSSGYIYKYAIAEVAKALEPFLKFKPKIGHVELSPNNRVPLGWKIWHENDIEAQIADYPKLIKEYKDGYLDGIVTNLDEENGTFIFKGHQNRYFRPAGSAVAAGEVLEDAIRNISGTFETRTYRSRNSYFSGSFGVLSNISDDDGWDGRTSSDVQKKISFDASKVVPTANENRPKTLGMNVLIYHGEGVD